MVDCRDRRLAEVLARSFFNLDRGCAAAFSGLCSWMIEAVETALETEESSMIATHRRSVKARVLGTCSFSVRSASRYDDVFFRVYS